ncbi:MAG: DNA cytosine methyltransferase, partial [Lachnospiraceae bacterium]|nr:DNA cytosine methyltransferase [Lachnospiraceae bacterium]
VLWWSINDIILARHPKYVLLENVDRLTRSPAKQRGRDFGIILRCLADAGYHVEWRIVNAAEYGLQQRMALWLRAGWIKPLLMVRLGEVQLMYSPLSVS